MPCRRLVHAGAGPRGGSGDIKGALDKDGLFGIQLPSLPVDRVDVLARLRQHQFGIRNSDELGGHIY